MDYSFSNFLVILNPTNNALPAVIKIAAGKATSSSKPRVVDNNSPIKIPKPIPINKRAKFKINCHELTKTEIIMKIVKLYEYN